MILEVVLVPLTGPDWEQWKRLKWPQKIDHLCRWRKPWHFQVTHCNNRRPTSFLLIHLFKTRYERGVNTGRSISTYWRTTTTPMPPSLLLGPTAISKLRPEHTSPTELLSNSYVSERISVNQCGPHDRYYSRSSRLGNRPEIFLEGILVAVSATGRTRHTCTDTSFRSERRQKNHPTKRRKEITEKENKTKTENTDEC